VEDDELTHVRSTGSERQRITEVQASHALCARASPSFSSLGGGGDRPAAMFSTPSKHVDGVLQLDAVEAELVHEHVCVDTRE
jgi:hypothetical protein